MTLESIPYGDFRTGLTWQAVRDELAREQRQARAAGGYMFVSRGTVLGRWRQHKLTLYGRFLECLPPWMGDGPPYRPERGPLPGGKR